MLEIIKELETRRKLFHMCAILLWLFPLKFFSSLLLHALFLVVLMINLATVFRLFEKGLSFYYRLVYLLERERNYSKPSIQALWANLGIYMVLLLFGREPAMVSVVVLAVGDAFASLVGMKYGRTRIGEKSLEGGVAFFLSSFLALLPFVGFWRAFLVSFISAFVELLPLKIDDNFIVPLTAGLVFYIMSRV